MRRSTKRLADSSLPSVSGVRTLQSRSSKPASLAKRHARPDLLRRPPEIVARADMLSATHSPGIPPMNLKVPSRHPNSSSTVLVGA